MAIANSKVTNKNQNRRTKFGTFGGVFTPSVLTILGVIMFLRFPMVAGYAGLWGVLLILFLAKSITFATALSVSSIATNMRVKGGGAYYMISRSLGVEFGSVIAVFFYLAQSAAVALYVIGFTEAIFSAFPNLPLSFLVVASIANILVFISVYVGAGWTIRVQYVILAVLMISIVSFFVGAWSQFSIPTLLSNLTSEWTPKYTFFTTFALFFPAVTGIMAGVNMSGDLQNPSGSLPKGTMLAIGFTAFIYLGIAFFLVSTNSRSVLLGESFVMGDTARWSVLIYAGVFCATLSSALSSMMGAPRVLQAFANDKVFSWLKLFGKGSGVSNEPRFAIILTFFISQIAILAGDLNTIAPIITMFFLITYGVLNLACFYESISKIPSFRPTFRMNHWSISLFGALACLVVMFLIHPLWALLAILLSAGMYVFVERSKIIVNWGDVNSGLAFQWARKALLKLEQKRYHPKNWRLSILTLSGGPYNRLHLTQYASLLTGQRGFVSIAQIITGKIEELYEVQASAEKQLRKFIREENLMAFPAVVLDEGFTSGLKALIQCHGIGGIKPNTVLLGWSHDPEKSKAFLDIISIVKRMKRNLIIVRCQKESQMWESPSGAINILWEDTLNGSMMLMLAYLLKENRQWRDCSLRILRPVPCKVDIDNMRRVMEEMLKNWRISAEIFIIPCENPMEAIREEMEPSAVLFAGFKIVKDEASNVERVSFQRDIMDLPGDIILVRSTDDFSLSA